MSATRLVAWVLVPLAVVLYGYRAYTGFVGGVAMARARLDNRHQRTAPLYEQAAVGENRFIAKRRASARWVDTWDDQAERGGPSGADPSILRRAAEGYLEALCLAPASWAPLEGLGVTYHKAEWLAREQRARAGFVSGLPAWARVGRLGRVAVGMMRASIASGPNWYLHHDALARVLWLYGLDPEAREAVRRSAHVLPIYYRHDYRVFGDVPEWLLDEFTDASREALGNVPFISLTDHLIDLGKMELRRGRSEQAAEVFRRALDLPGDDLNRGEIRLNLGLSLVNDGQFEEGRRHLLLASEVPVFKKGALLGLTSAAERAGEDSTALDYLRQLRRLEPTNIDHCLRFARIAARAEDWAAALEALDWARTVAPRDPRPLHAKVEVYRLRGDVSAARALEREIGELFPDTPAPGGP